MTPAHRPDDGLVTAHDRSEAQAVEIVFALLVGVAVGVLVVLVAWLLRLAIGTNGGPPWTLATAIAACSAGLASVVACLLRALRNGL
jgi:hypothetical protein